MSKIRRVLEVLRSLDQRFMWLVLCRIRWTGAGSLSSNFRWALLTGISWKGVAVSDIVDSWQEYILVDLSPEEKDRFIREGKPVSEIILDTEEFVRIGREEGLV